MIQYDSETQQETDKQQIEISDEVENLLTSKINECFSNEKFKELPIHIIHRVVRRCSADSIDNNKLFDIIVQSLSKFCILFPFLDLQKLSDDRLEELCAMYSKSNENTQHYFDFLKCNLNLINEINNRKKKLEEMNDQQQNKMSDLESKIETLQNQFINTEKVNNQLQNQLNDSKNLNDQQQNKMTDMESKITSLQSQLDDSQSLNNQQQNKIADLESKIALLQKQFDEKINEQLQHQVNYSKKLEDQISQLQNKLTNSEKEVTGMQKQLNELLIKGNIVANVEKGLLINAEIDLKTKGPALDTSKSKVIISTSDAKCLGSEAYEKGEPITSLHMKTTFMCKPGTYYVRCIIFNNGGESNEIVSNPVTASGSSLEFDYKREAEKITLPCGRYKLEVWGAKGGDSTGNGFYNGDSCYRGSSTAQGGLGGYSRGILNLGKSESVYVFVGGQGGAPSSADGSSSKGGFPDGGGAKTGHCGSFTTVPGTGGGSTSIRIGSATDYARVIVAGGGGGASGNSCYVEPGGFGGGPTGGNCHFCMSFQDQGAGTQTGSTRGLGHCADRHGDPGRFGAGATGKYCKGCDSGGGGGGGWFGGGSGGYGKNDCCSSGGGGSGWVFTASSLKNFQSGDSSNASKFVLSSAYYLSDVACLGGNEEFPRPDGNGNERGHSGNGYAKITPL